jgi:serine/threonine-protein kinase
MNTPEPEPPPPQSTPAGTSLVGQVVSGRYRIRELIGEGGMGAVYLAEHTLMRKRVALKLLHADMSRDEEVLARFKREAEAAAHVEHPNVATATDFGQTENGSFFLVLEYVEGTSLRKVIEHGPVHPARALHVARQIALALDRAHAAGIVHRDLKPENVMLVKKGDDPDFVKVLDFGIAKVERPARDTGQPLTRLGTILGTPEYMAPEQALGEKVGPAADLYAVGVILYEMLTGKHPFDTPDRMAILSMHIVAPVPRMSDRNPAIDVPAPIEQIVRRLLEKDATARPPSARALVDAIESAAAQSGVALPPTLSERSLGRESNRDRMRLPAPSATSSTEIAPQSVRAPESSSAPVHALAATDYGLPASVATATARTAQASATGPLQQLGKRLETLPRGLLIAAASVIPLLALTLVVALILGRRASIAEDAATDGGAPRASGVATKGARPTRASPERIAAAAAQGPAGLEALAKELPEDTAVQRQFVIALADVGRISDALRAIRTLAARDQTAIDDRILQIVLAAAERSETADEAFSLLEGALGARGVDGLIELSSSKSAPPATRSRATKSLSRSDVRANASAGTSVLLDLKSAKSCAAKKDLLERVKADGDARVLPTLKAMKNTRGCGFLGMRDCYPCLRRDGTLDEALAAVESRASR